jgi:hypothetical protein
MGGSNKNQTLEKKVDDILDIVIFLKDSIRNQFNAVDNRFAQMENRFVQIDNRFEQLTQEMRAGFAYVHQEIKEVGQRVTSLKTKVDRIDKRSVEDTDVIVNDVADHEVRIVRLEEQYV